MTVEELKSGIKQSSLEDRAYLAALLKHLGRWENVAYQADLSRLNKEIEDGHKFSIGQLKHLHNTLEAEGL